MKSDQPAGDELPPGAALAEERDRLYELALSEALRSLSYQERKLTNTRSRAGGVVTASIAATAFLGKVAIDNNADAIVIIIGFVVFILTFLIGGLGAAPIRTFYFMGDAQWIVTKVDEGVDRTSLLRQLSIYWAEKVIDNEKAHRFAQNCLTISSVLVTALIIYWLCAIGFAPGEDNVVDAPGAMSSLFRGAVVA